MPSIPVQTPLGYVGVFLVIAGLFLVIAGLDILKIEKLTIATGAKTWGCGFILAILGVFFLLPDIYTFLSPTPTPTPVQIAMEPPTITPAPLLTGAPIIASPTIPPQATTTSPTETIPSPEPTTTLLTMPPTGRIAFSSGRDGDREIYVMNADGSGQTNLSQNPSNDFRPSWSADGSRIAFGSQP